MFGISLETVYLKQFDRTYQCSGGSIPLCFYFLPNQLFASSLDTLSPHTGWSGKPGIYSFNVSNTK